ncbi:LruC domain-containing protein [Pelobium manganitolerans]|uniref:LruC domain-containing protein n=1 Tax=Pelobium manganitolerans TaxID=1842495 RepID=UPI003FA39611
MKRYLLVALLLSAFIACKKEDENNIVEPSPAESIAPNGFNFSTVKTVKIHLSLLSNINEPLANVPVTLHNPRTGSQLLKALTDVKGNIDVSLNIASYIDQVVVKVGYVGLPEEVLAYFDNNQLSLTIGGTNGLAGNFIVSASNKSAVSGKSTQAVRTLSSQFSYLGAYDDNGKPKHLTAQRGNVTADLLNFINVSLPSTIDVRTLHPEYLLDNAKQTLDLVKDGAVYLSFISESADFTNSIAFYTYPTDHPPTSASEIAEIKFAFPNASLAGLGGALVSGDRVKLGDFKAGTSVAFMLIANGWDTNTKVVKTDAVKYYSTKAFNPESDDALKAHTVLLHYAKDDLFVLGIEDLNRERVDDKCDHDFNDALLYAETFPKDAIRKGDYGSLDRPEDADGDGVTDLFDEYPNDPKKAYNNYFPSKDSWGTLAFEDNWPLKGDYDMNDLGINYRYSYVSNASNQVVEMTADYKVTTALAYFHNGFGVELPFAPSVVASTSGQVKSKNYIQTNANGTEAGQSKAVIIPFDDQKALANNNISVKLVFTSPQAASILSNAPYNPFLISDGRRSHEIHLPGKTPTALADQAVFGSADDKSSPGIGKYYIGTNNWPWALQFTEPFNYPAEGKAVNDAYAKFGAWAASGGTQFTDWYK